MLYVNDSKERVIWRYTVNRDLSLGTRTLMVDQRNDPRVGNPDGMKVDTQGRLWTTGAGGEKFSTLFLTARSSVYRLRTTISGIGPGTRRR